MTKENQELIDSILMAVYPSIFKTGIILEGLAKSDNLSTNDFGEVMSALAKIDYAISKMKELYNR